MFDIVDMRTIVGRSRQYSRSHGSTPRRTLPGGSGPASVYAGQHRRRRPNRASGIIGELAALGIVERREIGRMVMVSLVVRR